jgi:hypothetical protein
MPSPARVHVISDDPEFDSEFISHLQAEGFETTYLALIPSKNNNKADITPLLHIADDLERGELYGVVAFGAAATACLDFYSSAQPHCCALISNSDRQPQSQISSKSTQHHAPSSKPELRTSFSQLHVRERSAWIRRA